jgi:hypothetical protein
VLLDGDHGRTGTVLQLANGKNDSFFVRHDDDLLLLLNCLKRRVSEKVIHLHAGMRAEKSFCCRGNFVSPCALLFSGAAPGFCARGMYGKVYYKGLRKKSTEISYTSHRESRSTHCLWSKRSTPQSSTESKIVRLTTNGQTISFHSVYSE